MNKMIVFASLALLLSQCKPNAEIPKIPEGKEDGYVFYDGIRRFLSDGTEIEPLVTAISIDGEEIDIGSEKNRERIVSTRVSENRVECYFVPEEGSGLVFFSYDCLTGRTTEPRKVVGDPDDIGSDRVPGTRDRMCFWGPAGGPRTEGIVRDGVAYAVGRLNSVVHVSDRGEYELFDQDSTTYLAYRPFGEGGGLGERTIVRKRSLIGFVELDPSSPKRYFFAGTDDPRWYCFSEETLELEDLGPYEKDRYRFLNLHYKGEPGNGFVTGDSMATRYLVEEGEKTFLKDLRDPSCLLDVSEKIPEVENLRFAGYSEDMGLFYYSTFDDRSVGDGYLEAEGRWVGADVTNRMEDENGRLVRWSFSYPYLKTDRYDFRVKADNNHRFLDPSLSTYFLLIREDLAAKESYLAETKRYPQPCPGFILQTPFLYDCVDTKGDEILEIGPSLSPMVSVPR